MLRGREQDAAAVFEQPAIVELIPNPPTRTEVGARLSAKTALCSADDNNYDVNMTLIHEEIFSS